MENFSNIFIFLAHEDRGIRLNGDIFETNIINLFLLISLVFYIGKDFLKSTLTIRQRLIIDKIEEVDKKVNEANKRLIEARLQWSQANIVSINLQKRTLEKIKRYHELENSKNKEILLREWFSLLVILDLQNEHAQKRIRNFIIKSALTKVSETFNRLLINENFQEDYSNHSILLLDKLIGDN